MLYSEIGLAKGNLPKLLAACNGTEYLLAAFIPIFIIEKAGRRPLMLFGVCCSPMSPFSIRVANEELYTRLLVWRCLWLFLLVPTIA